MPTDVADGRTAQRPGRPDEQVSRWCPFAVDRKKLMEKKINEFSDIVAVLSSTEF